MVKLKEKGTDDIKGGKRLWEEGGRVSLCSARLYYNILPWLSHVRPNSSSNSDDSDTYLKERLENNNSNNNKTKVAVRTKNQHLGKRQVQKEMT